MWHSQDEEKYLELRQSLSAFKPLTAGLAFYPLGYEETNGQQSFLLGSCMTRVASCIPQ